MTAAEVALLDDLSFEHLGDGLRDAVWMFACQAYYNKGDQVAQFATEHRRPVESRKCYFTVQHLKVPKVVTFAGVELLPVDHPDVPGGDLFDTPAPVASVAVVEEAGTDSARIAKRGRAKVERALRLLRIALRSHFAINDKQLRFQLGVSYAVENEITGWISPAGTAYQLELGEELLNLAESQEVAALASQPKNDLERHADLATRWIEKARFETEPLDALLDLFSALEALLGDKSDGLKGLALAFRQALLGTVAGGGFTDPDDTFWLYDQVRSYALHGEEPPPVDEERVARFSGTVLRTLDLYLRFAKENSLIKRSRVNRALMRHASREGARRVAPSKWQT